MTPDHGMTRFRPAGGRFHSTNEWLDSWHTFSFASHYDPAWVGFGPLKVINDDTIAAGRGFGMHPHTNTEIITVMVEGQLNHVDSLGHAGVLHAGDVQCMSTGTGVRHSEINAGTSPCRLLQIWIEPNRPGIAPAYAQKPFAIGPDWTPLLDPERRQGAMAIHRPVRLWRAQPGPGIPLAVSIAAASRGWIQMITGSGLAGSQALQRGDGLGFGAGCLEDFRAGDGGADLLLFELR